jgi:hypothetical protein
MNWSFCLHFGSSLLFWDPERFISHRTRWPSYTPRRWVPFSFPPTTRWATVEVFDPFSTQGTPLQVSGVDIMLTGGRRTFVWSGSSSYCQKYRCCFDTSVGQRTLEVLHLWVTAFAHIPVTRIHRASRCAYEMHCKDLLWEHHWTCCCRSYTTRRAVMPSSSSFSSVFSCLITSGSRDENSPVHFFFPKSFRFDWFISAPFLCSQYFQLYGPPILFWVLPFVRFL